MKDDETPSFFSPPQQFLRNMAFHEKCIGVLRLQTEALIPRHSSKEGQVGEVSFALIRLLISSVDKRNPQLVSFFSFFLRQTQPQPDLAFLFLQLHNKILSRPGAF